MGRKRIYFTEEERKAAKRESNKRGYHRDIEKARRQRREWAKRNNDKLRPLWNLRDKRLRECEGHHTPEDIDRIYKLQKAKCAICEDKLTTFHKEHIVPISRGGSNWPANIQLLCPRCNLRKGSTDPIDHMRSLGKLL